jgi:peptidyl-prolyl cis-trans isomerase B (cyclophilin B)
MKIRKYFSFILITMFACAFVLVGCGNTNNKEGSNTQSKTSESNENGPSTESKNLPIATITVKDYGVIQVELYPNVAPNTVDNFIYLANKNFYNNLKFHRVIKGFMIQGGDPKGDGTGGPGYSIKGEFTANGFPNNLKHTRGVLSMARTQDPNSAGSQFFIMTGDAPNLDGQYAAFGKVISGMDVVDKIQNVETNSADAPKKDVIISSITVDTKGVEYKEPIKN